MEIFSSYRVSWNVPVCHFDSFCSIGYPAHLRTRLFVKGRNHGVDRRVYGLSFYTCGVLPKFQFFEKAARHCEPMAFETLCACLFANCYYVDYQCYYFVIFSNLIKLPRRC